jgi:hypothetical protein
MVAETDGEALWIEETDVEGEDHQGFLDGNLGVMMGLTGFHGSEEAMGVLGFDFLAVIEPEPLQGGVGVITGEKGEVVVLEPKEAFLDDGGVFPHLFCLPTHCLKDIVLGHGDPA